MFAILGKVEFDLITYFDGLETRFGAEYAEHALIALKPRLQFVGDALQAGLVATGGNQDALVEEALAGLGRVEDQTGGGDRDHLVGSFPQAAQHGLPEAGAASGEEVRQPDHVQ